jgi:two-component sensor histidine kinase
MPQPGTRVFQRLPVFSVQPRTTKAFALAATYAVAALCVRYVLGVVFPALPPFATFLVATMLSAILAGASAGFICAGLGLALAWPVFKEHVPAAFSSGGIFLYTLTSLLIIWIADEYRRLLRRIQDREQAADRQVKLIDAENRVLTMVASDQPLGATMEGLVKSIEAYLGHNVLASVLLLDADGKHLKHCAAPNLPDDYNRAIDGLEIGPGAGSCGTAAYTGKPVYVSDIDTDPLWKDFRDLADQYDLRACWSTPILSRANTVLGTFALYHRQPRRPEADELEIVNLLVKIAALAIERQWGREQRQMLLQEMSHRLKNSLSVVSSIASSTLRSHVEKSKYSDFEKRLMALGQVQTLITQSNWAGIGVRELIKNVATAPFADGEDRFVLEGPPVHLPAQLTLSFALSIHELCTNAVKYGALSQEGGRVEINWRYEAGENNKHFVLRWIEHGGPPVTEPKRKGFGSRMIKTAFAGAFGGDAVWSYSPNGIECEIRLPEGALAET